MNVLDAEKVQRAKELDQKLMRPLFVFRMAMCQLDRPGAEKRAIKAANEILEIINQ